MQRPINGCCVKYHIKRQMKQNIEFLLICSWYIWNYSDDDNTEQCEIIDCLVLLLGELTFSAAYSL